MKIRWIGHSSFVLTESTGISVLTDPYDPEVVGYGFEPPAVDLVTVSHASESHNFIKGVKAYKSIVDVPGKCDYEGIHVTGVSSNDGDDGSARGKNVIFKFGMDGVTVCHMGDICEPCSPELVERLMPVNVLLIPVGGNSTVDAELAKEYVDRLMPDIVIPMHYKAKRCELDIDKVDAFLRLFDDECVHEDITELELDRNDFNVGRDSTHVYVFKRDEQ